MLPTYHTNRNNTQKPHRIITNQILIVRFFERRGEVLSTTTRYNVIPIYLTVFR